MTTYLNEQVVVDTDSAYTYVGTLAEVTERTVRLREVAVYDQREARVHQEKYLIECAAYGPPVARQETLLERGRIVAITRLRAIIIPG